MSKKLTIEQVMTAFPHSIGHDQSLQVAKQLMHEYGVRHLPVKEGGRLVGILTDRDIHYALTDESKDENTIMAGDAYTPDPFTVQLDAPLHEVVDRMAKETIGCAIVLDDNKLAGIFTTVDACRVLAETLKAA